MKRLTIGVELCANPAILFLDEPTTGLDARSAHVVVDAIRKVAHTGRTVVCTVHQPSTDVFFAFDRLLLLAPGGYVVYEGALGQRARKLVDYLQAVPSVIALPPNTNPASWMLDVLYKTADPEAPAPAADGAPKAAHSHDSPPYFARVFKASELAAEASKDALAGLDPATFGAAAHGSETRMYGASLLVQAAYIGLRHWREELRLPDFMMIRTLITLFLALFFGLIWLGAGGTATDQASAYTALGIMTSTSVFLAITTFAVTAPIYAAQRSVFYREKVASYYSPEVYALTYLWVDLPWLVIQTLLFQAIFYPMVGFQWSATPFFSTCLATLMAMINYLCEAVRGQGRGAHSTCMCACACVRTASVRS